MKKGALPDFGAFDALRFVLASTVVLYHMQVIRWPYAGDLAVQVFFCLSGYLIGQLLVDTERDGLSRFYFHRVTRIWLPYAASLAVLYGLSLILPPGPNIWWRDYLVYDLSFTHNWFTELPNRAVAITQMPLKGTGLGYWSLSVEEQFYLFAPLVMVFLRGGRTPWVWGLIALAAWLQGGWYASVSLGVLAATVSRRHPDWHRRLTVRAACLALVLGGLAAMQLQPALYVYAAPPLGIALVLLAAQPVARPRWVRWLGGISYPLYLNAWIAAFVLHFIQKVAVPVQGFAAELLEFALAILIAAAAYQLVDVPVIRRRDRWFTVARGRWSARTAYLLMLSGVVYHYTLAVP